MLDLAIIVVTYLSLCLSAITVVALIFVLLLSMSKGLGYVRRLPGRARPLALRTHRRTGR